MVMHPTRDGVAIASLGNTFLPANGFHDDWYVFGETETLDEAATHGRIAERNANARLIAAAPDLLASLKEYAEGKYMSPAARARAQAAIDKAEAA